MTDEELGKALHLTADETQLVLSRISPQKRATYERLVHLADELNLWMTGKGPMPKGVIICKETE